MIRAAALLLIKLYQLVLSPLLRPSCRYLPTCSSYALTCVARFGAGRGSVLTLGRILRCHPWGGSGYDPPPVTLEKNRSTFVSRSFEGN